MVRGNARGWTGVVLAVALAASGCHGRPAAPAVVVRWCAGHTAPAFDPDGPPDALRFALERCLSRGLFERDSAGAVVPAAAERADVSPDGRTVTVTLRPGLRFTDGTRATSADFRTALLGGLAREDHATRAWLLGALAGVAKVRAGRPLPAIGIEARDARTLVLRLATPDPRLLEKLASPGVGVPWRDRAGAPGWSGAVGLGPYRVARELAGRELDLVRADSAATCAAAADTLAVRFVTGVPRVRTVLRRAAADLVWPLPPALLEQGLPEPWRWRSLAASPPRRLLLVLRADVPPTTKLPARHALVHSLNREDLLIALGRRDAAVTEWLAGGGPFEFPRLDAGETRSWLDRGQLGASFHVTLAYDADGEGAAVARALQGQWARLGLYAELRGQRGPAAAAEPLRAAAGQSQLVEVAAPLPGAAAELATLVMPLRGPAVGAFRTGWRTREFDRWIAPGADPAGLDAAAAQGRLADERIALPLADLPWTWVERGGARPVRFDPAGGAVFTTARAAAPSGR